MTEQAFKLLRRINLGNYEHYEIEVTIHDVDEKQAMLRALALYKDAADALKLSEKADVKPPENQRESKRTRREPSVELVKSMLPDPWIKRLNITVEAGNYILKPIHYLGSDQFAEIAQIVKDKLRGEYVSAGRDSHFRISVKELPQ